MAGKCGLDTNSRSNANAPYARLESPQPPTPPHHHPHAYPPAPFQPRPRDENGTKRALVAYSCCQFVVTVKLARGAFHNPSYLPIFRSFFLLRFIETVFLLTVAYVGSATIHNASATDARGLLYITSAINTQLQVHRALRQESGDPRRCRARHILGGAICNRHHESSRARQGESSGEKPTSDWNQPIRREMRVLN